MESISYLFDKGLVSKWTSRQQEAWRLRKESPGLFLYYFTLTGYSSHEPMSGEERDSIVCLIDALHQKRKSKLLTKEDWGFISNNVAGAQRTGRQCRDYIIKLGIDEGISLYQSAVYHEDVLDENGSPEYQAWVENEDHIARGALNTNGSRKIARAVNEIIKTISRNQSPKVPKVMLHKERLPTCEHYCITGETIQAFKERRSKTSPCVAYDDDNENMNNAVDSASEEEVVGVGIQNHKFQVNEHVFARWSGDNEFYPGKITKENLDGTFNILYDDGDSEKNLTYENLRKDNNWKKPDLIQASQSTTQDDNRLSSQEENEIYYREYDSEVSSYPDNSNDIDDEDYVDPSSSKKYKNRDGNGDGKSPGPDKSISTNVTNDESMSKAKRWNIIDDSSSEDEDEEITKMNHEENHEIVSVSTTTSKKRRTSSSSCEKDRIEVIHDESTTNHSTTSMELSRDQVVYDSPNSSSSEEDLPSNSVTSRRRSYENKSTEEHRAGLKSNGGHVDEENEFSFEEDSEVIEENEEPIEGADDLNGFFNGWDDEETAVLPIAMRKKEYKKLMSMKASKCFSKLKKIIKKLASKLETAEKDVQRLETRFDINIASKLKRQLEENIQQNSLEVCRILMSRLEKSNKRKYSGDALIPIDSAYSEYDRKATALIKRLKSSWMNIETKNNEDKENSLSPSLNIRTSSTPSPSPDSNNHTRKVKRSHRKKRKRASSEDYDLHDVSTEQSPYDRNNKKKKRTANVTRFDDTLSDDNIGDNMSDIASPVDSTHRKKTRTNAYQKSSQMTTDGFLTGTGIDSRESTVMRNHTSVHGDEDHGLSDYGLENNNLSESEDDHNYDDGLKSISRLILKYTREVNKLISQQQQQQQRQRGVPAKKRYGQNPSNVAFKDIQNVKEKGTQLQNQLQTLLDDFSYGGDALFGTLYEDATRLHRNLQLNINMLQEEESKARAEIRHTQYAQTRNNRRMTKKRSLQRSMSRRTKSDFSSIDRLLGRFAEQNRKRIGQSSNVNETIYESRFDSNDNVLNDEEEYFEEDVDENINQNTRNKDPKVIQMKESYPISVSKRQIPIKQSFNLTRNQKSSDLTVDDQENDEIDIGLTDSIEEIDETVSSLSHLDPPRVRMRPLFSRNLESISWRDSQNVNKIELWDPLTDSNPCLKIIPFDLGLNGDVLNVFRQGLLLFRQTFSKASLNMKRVNRRISECYSLALAGGDIDDFDLLIAEFRTFVCDPKCAMFHCNDEKPLSTLRLQVYLILFVLLTNHINTNSHLDSVHSLRFPFSDISIQDGKAQNGNAQMGGLNPNPSPGPVLITAYKILFAFAKVLLHDLIFLFIDAEVKKRPWKRGIVFVQNNTSEDIDDSLHRLKQSPLMKLWKMVMNELENVGVQVNGKQGGFWLTFNEILSSVHSINELESLLSTSASRFSLLHGNMIYTERKTAPSKDKEEIIRNSLEWSEACWDILFHCLPLYSAFDPNGKWKVQHDDDEEKIDEFPEQAMSAVMTLIKKYSPMLRCKNFEDVQLWKKCIAWLNGSKIEDHGKCLLSYCMRLMERIRLFGRRRLLAFPSTFLSQIWGGIQLITSCLSHVENSFGLDGAISKLIQDEFQLNASVTQRNRLYSALLNLLPQKKSIISKKKTAIYKENKEKACYEISLASVRKQIWSYCALRNCCRLIIALSNDANESQLRKLSSRACMLVDVRNSDDKAREILLESVCTLMRKLQEKGLKMSDLSQKETMMNSSVENRLNKRVGAFGDLVLMILLCTVCDYKNLQKTLHDHNQRMLRQQQKEEELQRILARSKFKKKVYRNYHKKNQRASDRLLQDAEQSSKTKANPSAGNVEVDTIAIAQAQQNQLLLIEKCLVGLADMLEFGAGTSWKCNELAIVCPALNAVLSIKTKEKHSYNKILVAALSLMANTVSGLLPKSKPWFVELNPEQFPMGVYPEKVKKKKDASSQNYGDSIDDIMASLDVEALVLEKKKEALRNLMLDNTQNAWEMYLKAMLSSNRTSMHDVSRMSSSFINIVISTLKNWWLSREGGKREFLVSDTSLVEKGTGYAAQFLGVVAAFGFKAIPSSFKMDKLTWLLPKPSHLCGARTVPVRVHGEIFIAHILLGKDPVTQTGIPLNQWLNLWLVATFDHATLSTGAGTLYFSWTRRLGEYSVWKQGKLAQNHHHNITTQQQDPQPHFILLRLAESLLKPLLTTNVQLSDENQYQLRFSLLSSFCSELDIIWGETKTLGGSRVQSIRNLLNGIYTQVFDVVVKQSMSELVSNQLKQLGLGKRFFQAKSDFAQYMDFVFKAAKVTLQSCGEIMYIPGGSAQQNVLKQLISTCMTIQPKQLDLELGNISKPQKHSKVGASEALLSASKTSHFILVLPSLLMVLYDTGTAVEKEILTLLEQFALYIHHLSNSAEIKKTCKNVIMVLNENEDRNVNGGVAWTSHLLSGKYNHTINKLNEHVATVKTYAPIVEMAKGNQSAAIQSGAMKATHQLLLASKPNSLQRLCAKSLFNVEESILL